MKKLGLGLTMILIAGSAISQTSLVDAQKVNVRDTLKLRGVAIGAIDKDTAMAANSDSRLATQKAIREFVLGRINTAALSDSAKVKSVITVRLFGDSHTELGGVTSVPSWLSIMSNYNTINHGISGQTSTQIRTRFIADSANHHLPTIISAGANNVQDVATIKADINTMAAALRAKGNNRFIILSIINGLRANYGIGGHLYDSMLTINSYLATTYPDNYVNIRSYIVNKYNPSLSSDVYHYNLDQPPPSLMGDSVHLNAEGRRIYTEAFIPYTGILTDTSKVALRVGDINYFLKNIPSFKGNSAALNQLVINGNETIKVGLDTAAFIRGNSYFHNNENGRVSEGGLQIRSRFANNGGSPVMEIAGTNPSFWGLNNGISFLNNERTINIGGNITHQGNIVSTGGFINSGASIDSSNFYYTSKSATGAAGLRMYGSETANFNFASTLSSNNPLRFLGWSKLALQQPIVFGVTDGQINGTEDLNGSVTIAGGNTGNGSFIRLNSRGAASKDLELWIDYAGGNPALLSVHSSAGGAAIRNNLFTMDPAGQSIFKPFSGLALKIDASGQFVGTNAFEVHDGGGLKFSVTKGGAVSASTLTATTNGTFGGNIVSGLASWPSAINTSIGTANVNSAMNNNLNPNAIYLAYGANATGAGFIGAKTRSTDGTGLTSIVSGDDLMGLRGWGTDGTQYKEAASIKLSTEGTIGVNRIPGVFRVFTATNASPSVLTERLTINSSGVTTITNLSDASGVARMVTTTNGVLSYQDIPSGGSGEVNTASNVFLAGQSYTAHGLYKTKVGVDLRFKSLVAGTGISITTPNDEELFIFSNAANTMAAVGSTPNANGGTISGGALTLQPASAAYGGVVTTGTQILAGEKTFSNTATFSSYVTNSVNTITADASTIVQATHTILASALTGVNRILNLPTVASGTYITINNRNNTAYNWTFHVPVRNPDGTTFSVVDNNTTYTLIYTTEWNLINKQQ